MKIWKFACLFDLCNWMNQSSFEVILIDNVLINGHCLKNTNEQFRWKLLYVRIWFLYGCHPQWSSYSKNFILKSGTPSNFIALAIKKLAIVGKILWPSGFDNWRTLRTYKRLLLFAYARFWRTLIFFVLVFKVSKIFWLF